MAKETLVGLVLEGGKRILAVLDEGNFPAPVAVWIRREPQEEWTLLSFAVYEKLPLGDANLKMVQALWPT